MKMMWNKIPPPILASVIVSVFFLFAGSTAFYLNAPPLPEPTPPPQTYAMPVVKTEPIPAAVSVLITAVDLQDPNPDAVCLDAEAPDLVAALLADAGETTKPDTQEPPPTEPRKPDPPFHRLILQAADTHGVEPALIKAVILAESNYNSKAVSKRGARGLMQLMPRTAAALGVSDVFDPEENINGGVKYLRQLLDRFDNDVRLALAAYNAGSRHVRNYNGVPPFPATRLYIKKVFKFQALFEEEMATDRQTV